jgi:hypothetical protein
MKKNNSILAVVFIVVGAMALGLFGGLMIAKNSPGSAEIVVTEAPVVAVPTLVATEAPVVVIPTETIEPVVEPTHDTRPVFYISDWRVTGPEEDEIVYPTEPFTKTVILFNGGQSEWGKDFRLVWVGGDFMGTKEIQIGQKVQPGGFGQFDINLMAPNGKAGVYTSWWMLKTEDGVMFGSGYDGLRVVAISVVVE